MIAIMAGCVDALTGNPSPLTGSRQRGPDWPAQAPSQAGMRAVDLAEGSLDGSIRAASGAQLVCQLPPRDVNRLAAGGRIQPRIRVCATGATDPMWLPLLAATRCAHQLLHPLPLPTLPTCYRLNSAQRSRLSRCCRVAQPTDPGWPSLARLAADARMRCRLPGPSRQLRQADCLKPSFLLAPNRSADDQCHP